MKFGLHLLKNPSGTYSFVGSVPVELAVYNPDNLPLNELLEAVQRDSMLPGKYRKFKEKTFRCPITAIVIANGIGYSVNNESEFL
jgi:hypothetical protein